MSTLVRTPDGPPRRWPAWLTLAGVVLLLALGGWYRQALGTYNGDEPTFLAMTASLAEDGDLAVAATDRRRLGSLFGDQHWLLILQRSDGGIRYSKPIAFPLAAAPFYRLLGPSGLIALNVLALGLALFVTRCWLARVGSPVAADWALVSFAGTGVLLPYGGWMMSDALQIACALAGSVLALGAVRWGGRGTENEERESSVERSDREAVARRWLEGMGAALAGGALLGVLVTMRYPNGLVIVAVTGALLAAGSWRRALGVVTAAGAAFLLVSGLTAATTGSWNPYGVPRTAFRSPAELRVDAADEVFADRFGKHPATHHLDWRARFEPVTSAYAALYFLVGRHTGLLIYFPAVLVLVPWALRRGDRVSWCLLAGFAGLALFYLLWVPRTYFGGGTFLGNRYIVTAMPLLLLALPRLPRPRAWIAAWAVAVLAAGSAVASMSRPGVGRADPQNHAYAGLFRLLPYESVAQSIGSGRRDRYWADDLVRFVDPFAERGDSSFRLVAATTSPAELMIATSWEPRKLLLHVRSLQPRLVLEADARGASRSLQLGPTPAGVAQMVELELPSPWRRHPFWWQRRPDYWVRLLRLRVRDPRGRPADAEITYLGRGTLLRVFPRQVRSVDVPAAGGAGRSLPLRIGLRNASPVQWPAAGVAPVHLGWRLAAAADGATTWGSLPLPRSVQSGDPVEIRGDIPLPAAPGPYHLRLDLRLGTVRWFAEELGEPVHETSIAVRATP